LLQRADPLPQLQFSRRVTFGDRDGPGFLGLPADVGHRKNGEWVVTDQTNRTEVKFFGADGVWLRTLGRAGDGPGEFRWALTLAVEPNDGLRVFDGRLGRITEYSPDLRVNGTAPGPQQAFSMAFLSGGRLVFAAQRNTRAGIGLPLHLMDPTGRIVHSFGADPPITEWGNPHKVWRTVAPSRDSAVWAAHLTEYQVERWTLMGARTHTFLGEVSWFKPQARFGRGSGPDAPPAGGLFRIRADPQGRLWLAFLVPDLQWKSALTSTTGPSGQTRWVSRDYNLLYDTIIEVVDVEKGRVIASGRHPSSIWGFTNEGDLIFHRYLEETWPVCEVRRVRVPSHSSNLGGAA
jgi:hypothetical protein